jgi:Cdc6-like AAA superfamily ATPase
MSGNCGSSKRAHTPYTSKAQTTAGNIALAARKGEIPKSKLKGASKEMAKGMTMKELKSHSAEAKGKELPQYVKRSVRGSEPFSEKEIFQGYRKL